MRLSEIIKSSLGTLKSNGRRTFLTMIGIIIGIAAVITILSLGNGFRKQTVDSLAKDPKGRISQSFTYAGNGKGNPNRKIEPFSAENLKTIMAMDGVDEAKVDAPTASPYQFMTLSVRNKKTPYNVSAVESSNHTMIAGRNLTAEDSKSKKRFVIVNEAFAIEHFKDPQLAVHQSVELENRLYTIVGVFQSPAPTGQTQLFGDAGPQNNPIELPKGTHELDNEANAIPTSMTVYFKAGADNQAISKKIDQYLKDNGGAREEGSYSYFDQSAIMNEIGKTLSMITLFITAVAAISLFIAGVGVMNMMYISVSERTKEIGIRRSLGATKQSIQLQFLLEGISITTLGGLIGYASGIGIAIAIGNFLPFKAAIEFDTAIISVLVSMAIGVVFSVFPARAAARKNVVDILRS